MLLSMTVSEYFVISDKSTIVGKGESVIEALQDAGLNTTEAALSPDEGLRDPNNFLVAHASDKLKMGDINSQAFEVDVSNGLGVGRYFKLCPQ